MFGSDILAIVSLSGVYANLGDSGIAPPIENAITDFGGAVIIDFGGAIITDS